VTDVAIQRYSIPANPAAGCDCFHKNASSTQKGGVVCGQPQAVRPDRTSFSPRLTREPDYKPGNGRRKRPESLPGTSTSGCLAGSLLYSTVRPRQFIVVPLPKTSQEPGPSHRQCRPRLWSTASPMVLASDSKRPARAEHAPLVSSAATARGTSPEMPACSRNRILSRTPRRPKLSFGRPTSRSALDSDAAKNGSPGLVASQWPLSTPRESLKASQPFRCGICARHHPNRYQRNRKHFCRGHWPQETLSCCTGIKQRANGLRLPCRNSARVEASTIRCPGPASTWAPLPDFRISITWRTYAKHRRPSRPLKSFLR
jgi:hypothetical protein